MQAMTYASENARTDTARSVIDDSTHSMMSAQVDPRASFVPPTLSSAGPPMMTETVLDEAGMTLIELLIAMTLMAIGIAAVVAGFGSGVLAVGRASELTTAAALADKQMETFRQESYSAISIGTATTFPAGSDGRTYKVTTMVGWGCVDAATPPSCSGSVGTPVKQVTIAVVDPPSNTTLLTETSTFDAATG